MNISYLQHRAVTRVWAAVTMFAVLLSAFVAPFSVAFAEGTDPEVAETTVVETESPADTEEESQEESQEEESESLETPVSTFGFTEDDSEEGEFSSTEDEELQGSETSMMRGGPSFNEEGRGWGNHFDKDKVTICHFDREAGEFEKKSLFGFALAGHLVHSDDIFPEIRFFLPNGKNLTTVYEQFGGVTGAEILENDCEIPEAPKEVKIIATKIVCADETLLPDDGYTQINANTAADFITANPSCALADNFDFQYAVGGKSTAQSPDNAGELITDGWMPAVTTVGGVATMVIDEEELGNNTVVSVREVANDDYIPFTGTGGSDVSAEIYCHTDAANFDNLDWIQNVATENTYYCVAWNVPKPPKPVACELTIKSDADDLVVEKNAYAKLLSSPLNSSWVPAIPSSVAKWIWGDNPVALPTSVDETQTFKKSFTWNGLTIDSAVLTLASDNSHAITLGTFAGGDAGEFNYGATKNYNVASAIATGTNTLAVAVKNFGVAGTNASSNPAGLIYELKIKGTGTSENCGVVVPLEPEKPKVAEVTMCKVDGNKNALPNWDLMLLGDKVATKVVSATNGTGETVNLNTGAYVAVASGTWNNNRGPLNIVDAEYSTEDNWVTQMDGFTGYGTDILELQLNGAIDPNSNWGAYNSGHRYARAFTQVATGTATFAIYDTNYGDNTGSLNLDVFKGYAATTNEDGCVTFSNVPYGTYSVDEIMKDGWTNVSGLGEVKVDAPTEEFNVVNRPTLTPTEPVATVIAHKIVCTNEADLPNWGAVDANTISSTTAATWVANHASCKFEAGWDFEWAPQGTTNPDNALPTTALYGAAGGNWTIFGSTDANGKAQVQLTASQIAGMSNIWVREVLETGYIPFTYGPTNATNTNNVTAEIYCHTDAFNYDNYDRVDGIKVGETYNCVAWNHKVESEDPEDPEEPAPVCDIKQNLIANGSFEADVVTDASLWQKFASVMGWATTKVADSASTTLELHKGWSGNQAADGLQYAELDGDVSSMVSQNIVTIPGKSYELQWSFAPRHNLDAVENKLAVLVNNSVVAQNGPATGTAPLATADWVNATTSFVATGTSTKITFADYGPSNSYGTFVDNVKAYCLPTTTDDGDDEVVTPDPEDEDTTRRSGGGGGTLVKRPTPAVAGDSISVPGLMPLVLGEQVTAVPYGAPGTGHGGSAATTGLTLLQILFMQRRKDIA